MHRGADIVSLGQSLALARSPALSAFGDQRLDADLQRILAVPEGFGAKPKGKSGRLVVACAGLLAGVTILLTVESLPSELRLFGAPQRSAPATPTSWAFAPPPTIEGSLASEPEAGAAALAQTAEAEPEGRREAAPARTRAKPAARERSRPEVARSTPDSAPPAASQSQPSAQGRIEVRGRHEAPRIVRYAGPRNTVRIPSRNSVRAAPPPQVRRGPRHMR